MLHDVCYTDTDADQGGRRRPVMHRGSIVEMAVPCESSVVCVWREGVTGVCWC